MLRSCRSSRSRKARTASRMLRLCVSTTSRSTGRRPTSSLILVAIDSFTPFLLNSFQVFVVQIVSDGNILPIPLSPIAGLVSRHEEDGVSFRIKAEQDSKLRPSRRAWPNFLHVLVPRTTDRVNNGPPKLWSLFLEQLQCSNNELVRLLVQFQKPAFDERYINGPHPTYRVEQVPTISHTFWASSKSTTFWVVPSWALAGRSRVRGPVGLGGIVATRSAFRSPLNCYSAPPPYLLRKHFEPDAHFRDLPGGLEGWGRQGSLPTRLTVSRRPAPTRLRSRLRPVPVPSLPVRATPRGRVRLGAACRGGAGAHRSRGLRELPRWAGSRWGRSC